MTTSPTQGSEQSAPVDALEFAYIGIKPCGCVVSACVDTTNNKEQTAKFVAGEVKHGRTIERILVEEARSRLKRCACTITIHSKPRAKKRKA